MISKFSILYIFVLGSSAAYALQNIKCKQFTPQRTVYCPLTKPGTNISLTTSNFYAPLIDEQESEINPIPDKRWCPICKVHHDPVNKMMHIGPIRVTLKQMNDKEPSDIHLKIEISQSRSIQCIQYFLAYVILFYGIYSILPYIPLNIPNEPHS